MSAINCTENTHQHTSDTHLGGKMGCKRSWLKMDLL